MTQKYEKDLIVRCLSRNESEVNKCYLDSTFLGHGGHQNLPKHFDDAAECLDRGRLYPISMDDPSVIKKFLSGDNQY